MNRKIFLSKTMWLVKTQLMVVVFVCDERCVSLINPIKYNISVYLYYIFVKKKIVFTNNVLCVYVCFVFVFSISTFLTE